MFLVKNGDSSIDSWSFGNVRLKTNSIFYVWAGKRNFLKILNSSQQEV